MVRRTSVAIDWRAGICFALCLLATRVAAQIPPVAAGFPNVAQTPGAILSGLNAPQQGRTAIIAYQDGILFTVPEVPSSQPGADFQVRTWDIRDPRNPIELARWGVTPMPINAHGYFHSGPYLVLGANWPPGGEWSFRVSPSRVVTRTSFPDLTCAGARGCLFGPWYINDTYWSYGAVGGDAEIWLDWQLLSSWDHLGTTGVIGHPFLIGDLLIFASDQSRTGVATYNVSDPRHPVLLDVLTTGGPGGYFPELWGGDGKLYIVFPYQTEGNGFRVVDATDPSNLRFVTDRALPGAASMYIQFQDEFAFMGGHKVDMRSFESVLHLDGENVARPNQPGRTGIDTSQFLLPLGNLLVTGGIGENEGMAIWAHQAEPDTRGPSVGFHIPQAGRTHYPLGAPISLLIHETLATATIVNGESFIVRRLGGPALAGRITFSFDDVLTFQPNAPLQANTTYEVVIPAGGIKDVAGNGIAGYSFTFSTGATVGGNGPPRITAFDGSPYPAAPGASVTLTANATDPNGDSLEYRFDRGDGSAKTAWSTLRSVGATYAAAGHYRATVQVRDPSGSLASESTVVTVVAPPSASRPTQSSQIACDTARRRIWSVNPDSDTITGLNADTLAVEREIPACADPRGVALAASGDLWVTCHDEDRVVVLASDGTLRGSVALGYGSAPVGIAASPDGATMYVALQGAGALSRLNVATRTQTGRLSLGPRPRAVAVSADGARVLVTRFLSTTDRAEVWDVNAANLTLTRTIAIPKFGGDANRDSTGAGRGVANYLTAIAIAPDGRSAWIAANKPNSERGLLVATDLDQDNTVRDVVVQLDLTTNTVARAVDIDNSDSASALAFSPFGDYLLVTLQGNNEVLVLDTLALDDAAGLGGFVTRLVAGRAPQGICVDAQTERTLVANLLSRDVTALETSPLFRDGVVSVASSSVATVASERLAPTVLAGKRIFYDASDRRMSAEGYMSCATCHVDGGHDGRTWDFTGRGEGLRNTTTLHGRGGTAHGNVHWTANFDEIQDFEHDMRNAFGGSGFLSASDFAAAGTPLGAAKAGRSPDLDALSDYVASLGTASLPRSPFRNTDGSMTAEATTGQAVFANLACANCHAGARMTDSTRPTATLRDVGTLRTTSGQRLGGPLTGIDTPTLLGAWDTAPYFHDGSAASLDDVFRVVGGTVLQAEAGAVSNGAQVVTDWVEFNNDDTVRSRRYVALGSQNSRVTFSNVNGGAGGNGAIEVRYSSGYGVFNLTLTVNGTTRTASLPLLGNDPGWRHVNWGRVRFEDVPLNAGGSNTIALSTTSQFPNISIDEIVVGTSANVTAAAPHRAALALSTSDRNALIAYLRQLDGNPPQGPQPTATVPPTPTRTPTTTPTSGQTATPTSMTGRYPLGGAVRHVGSGAAITGATLMLRGALDDEQTSGTGGAYVFRDLPAGSYTIAGQRLGAAAAVTSVDAQRALQASVGLQPTTGMQSLACDVTGDGRVTATDAARILQYLSGRITRFPVALACQSDWLFTPAAGVAGSAPVIQSGQCTPGVISVPSLGAPVANADLNAAAFGDCNLQ